VPLAYLSLAVLALLPLLVAWLIAIVPVRRVSATGVLVGNRLNGAPLAALVDVVPEPLVHLSLALSAKDIEGFILGMRHLPITETAPLLRRYVRCSDPALQLYAQSILQEGRDRLAHAYHLLQNTDPTDARKAAWLLEVGLDLAHPSLATQAERPGLLNHLAHFAQQRLQTAPHDPMLISQAIRVFLAAGKAGYAQLLLKKLPPNSPFLKELTPSVACALHLQQAA
jgi:hypothetical protein